MPVTSVTVVWICSTIAGRSTLEPVAHVVRRLRDQLLEDVPRDVVAQAELGGEDGIAVGALDHVQEAEPESVRRCSLPPK